MLTRFGLNLFCSVPLRGQGPFIAKHSSLFWEQLHFCSSTERASACRLTDACYFGLLADCTCISAQDRHNTICPLQRSGNMKNNAKKKKRKNEHTPCLSCALWIWLVTESRWYTFILFQAIFFPKTMAHFIYQRLTWQVTGCNNKRKYGCLIKVSERTCMNSYIIQQL